LELAAVIVAAGRSTRFGDGLSKNFQLLSGKPVVWHSLKAFTSTFPDIRVVLVVEEDFRHELSRFVEIVEMSWKVVSGGKSRSESVQRGLKHLSDSDYVFVHDGARPSLSQDLLQKLLTTAEQYGNAVPVLPVRYSLRKRTASKSESSNRSAFVEVQTPQCFQFSQLRSAYNRTFDADAYDDSQLVEAAGYEIHHVDGHRSNIKITYPEDLEIAETYLKHGRSEG
jgi:2-C-methyl-D-erythritol 4-phosphate cytidylyltransferase